MDHWRSHIPKNNPSKQFCEWSFEQGDRKWQQDELELGFDLVGDFFLEEDEVCGCWNKWRGATWGPQDRGAPQGVGAPWTLMARWWLPLLCSRCQIFSNILEKIIFHFRGIWRTFIFGVFFIARIIQKTDRKYYFCFI